MSWPRPSGTGCARLDAVSIMVLSHLPAIWHRRPRRQLRHLPHRPELRQRGRMHHHPGGSADVVAQGHGGRHGARPHPRGGGHLPPELRAHQSAMARHEDAPAVVQHVRRADGARGDLGVRHHLRVHAAAGDLGEDLGGAERGRADAVVGRADGGRAARGDDRVERRHLQRVGDGVLRDIDASVMERGSVSGVAITASAISDFLFRVYILPSRRIDV